MNDYMLFAIAMIPVLWLIISLGVLKMPAHKTCSFTVILTLIIAMICWRMKFIDGITATVEGMAIALWPILLVIVAALFTYNLAVETKTMDVIKKMLSSITASILASLGFNPIFAAVICLLANTVPTAFGALGIPVTTLATVTGLEVVHLSYVTSIQLAGFIILIPFLLVILTEKSIKALKGVVGITLISGITFAVPQIITV